MPTKVIVVHGGKVVVNERHGVDHLRAEGRGHGGLHGSPEHLARRDRQDGPDALPPRHQGVPHRLADLNREEAGTSRGRVF